MKIGFFGLGNMGLPMAINLVKAGFDVHGYDISSEAIEKFNQAGGKGMTNVKETCLDRELIISMLPNGSIVKELYKGTDGVFAHSKKGILLIDCSTIAAADATYIASNAKEHGFNMIDAPVSGGVSGAEGGTLTFIVGGEVDSLKIGTPILEKMGKNIFHAGKSGAGQIAKICNNMLLAIHMIGTSEALNLGMKHGLDPKVLSEIMKSSSGDNWSLQKYNPVPGVMESTPSSKKYNGGFGSQLMLKDLTLAQEAAENSSTSTPLGKMAQNMYEAHCETDAKGKDFSSIINFIK